jgi:glyoxylase-like metal-dependent hydrolase (beta-lactamase superfamily II)
MNLEDHVGDVVGKARTAAGVSKEEAARLAGLPPGEYQAWEATGQATRRPEYAALAARLGLHPAKLAGLARGWRPPVIDLGRWQVLHQITTAGAGFSVNCGPVFALLDQHRLELRHLFITHTHFDHVAAVNAIRQRYPQLRLYPQAARPPGSPKPGSGPGVAVGRLQVAFRATPGHAEDAVTYVVDHWPEAAPAVALVGDAIFAGSMGKAGAQAELARQVIREQILSLPPATLLAPGHGPVTTVGEEQRHNPFF